MSRRSGDVQTTVKVPEAIWRALRALAEAKALAGGGKPSVSGAIVSLVTAELARREQADA